MYFLKHGVRHLCTTNACTDIPISFIVLVIQLRPRNYYFIAIQLGGVRTVSDSNNVRILCNTVTNLLEDCSTTFSGQCRTGCVFL